MATAPSMQNWGQDDPFVSSALKKARPTEPMAMTQTAPGTYAPASFAGTQPSGGQPGQPPQAGQQPGGQFYQNQTFGAGQPSLTAQQPQIGQRFQQPVANTPERVSTASQAHQWTNQVYNSILGRPPTEQELSAWGAGLIHGGWTPAQMLSVVQGYPDALQQQPSWSPSAPTYQPGQIPDLQFGPSAQQSLTEMTQGMQPSQVQSGYQFGGFGELPAYGVNPEIEGMTSSAVRNILENPYSLGERELEMMKAASREEALALSQGRQAELERAGQRMGITESPWLRGAEAEERRGRDENLIGINRAIELEAADRRAREAEAAARLGMGYLDAESARKLAERGQVFGERATGEQFRQQAGAMDLQAQMANQSNIFNYDRMRTDAAVQGAQIDISRALASNDRIQLRETVNQEATRLGQSADKIQQDYVIQQMAQIQQRYGIDLSAHIDLQQLKQQDRQFAEDLAFRIEALNKQLELSYAQLREGGRQFDVGASLDLAGLQQQANQFAQNQWLSAYGGG